MFYSIYNLTCYLFFLGTSQSLADQPDFSQDVVDAVELLLQHTPLLDTVDVKCSCNCVECLITELGRVGLVSESHVKMYSTKRYFILFLFATCNTHRMSTMSYNGGFKPCIHYCYYDCFKYLLRYVLFIKT
jgi:hypothetical protein